MFHFVTGGVTPAALGGDWLASALDKNAFSWVGTPLGSRLEAVTIGWLKELFELPASWAGVLTTGATMANFRRSPRLVAGSVNATAWTWRSGASPAYRRSRCSRAATCTRARKALAYSASDGRACDGSRATAWAGSLAAGVGEPTR